MIDGLPTASAYREAIALDEELAAVVAEQPAKEPKPWRPPISEHTVEAELLSQLIDLVKGTVASLSRSKKRPEPTLRPYTAHETVKRKRRIADRERALDRISQAHQTWTREHGPDN